MGGAHLFWAPVNVVTPPNAGIYAAPRVERLFWTSLNAAASLNADLSGMYACENADPFWVHLGFVSGVHLSDATSIFLNLEIAYLFVVVQTWSYIALKW